MSYHSDLIRNGTAELMRTAREAGYDVYAPDPFTSWFYFTDGANIGYAQYDALSGPSLSTVHVPSRAHGTGRGVSGYDVTAFRVAANAKGPERRYADFEQFRRAHWCQLVKVAAQ